MPGAALRETGEPTAIAAMPDVLAASTPLIGWEREYRWAVESKPALLVDEGATADLLRPWIR